ncbi:RnfABCDGE type electron transport complex subunit D [Ileibacterium valens]|uniref:RnfABCDGE type electron transport complex subunit D n=1 Tax=Ileibacterium valens TaxID=1862668 RepID=UPI0035147FDB
MKFAFHVSPNEQQKHASTQQIMRDLTIALGVVFLCSLAYYAISYGVNYALQEIILLAASLVTTFVCEAIFAKVKKIDIKEFITHSFGWVTALILVMMCPVNISVYAVIIATVFAIVIGRLVFGGFGNNIYNPAAVGRAVIFASFSGAVTNLTTSATPTGVLASSFRWMPGSAEALESFLDTTGGWFGLAMGTYPGAIGETFSIAIILVGIFLIVRNVIDWRMPAVYLGTIFIITFFIAIFSGIQPYGVIPGWLWYPMLHLLTGGVIFGAFFMLTDPVTIPTVPASRVFFAACAAVITVLIRMKGNLPEGCLYSILIMNTFTPMIEQALDAPQFEQKKKAIIMSACALVLGLGVAFYASSTIRPVKGARNVGEETAMVITQTEQEDFS